MVGEKFKNDCNSRFIEILILQILVDTLQGVQGRMFHALSHPKRKCPLLLIGGQSKIGATVFNSLTTS